MNRITDGCRRQLEDLLVRYDAATHEYHVAKEVFLDKLEDHEIAANNLAAGVQMLLALTHDGPPQDAVATERQDSTEAASQDG